MSKGLVNYFIKFSYKKARLYVSLYSNKPDSISGVRLLRPFFVMNPENPPKSSKRADLFPNVVKVSKSSNEFRL